MPGALIRANRSEVSDRFPLLGFTVRTGARPWFEVTITTQPELLAAAKKGARTPNTFWSSRGLGPLAAEKGEAVFLVPDDALRRFAGAERLYYTVATFTDRTRGNADVPSIDASVVPFVNVSPSYAGRRMRQLVGTRNGGTRWNSGGSDAGSYTGAGSGDSLEWAGDAAKPGSEPTSGSGSPAASTGSPGGLPGSPATSAGLAYDVSYDDGYPDSLWKEPSRPTAPGTGVPSTDTFDISWGDVPLIAEANGMTCAAAAAAMIAAWRDKPVTAEERLDAPPPTINDLRQPPQPSDDNADQVATIYGLLRASSNVTDLRTLREMLSARGPLWIGDSGSADHAVVVTGMYGDGTPDGTYVRINDPRFRTARSPRSVPGTASQYVLTGTQFNQEHGAAAGGGALAVLHVKPEHLKGRTPIVTSQAYALWKQASRTRQTRSGRTAQAQAAPVVVPIAATILGTTMTRVLNNEGDVKWELDQLRGIKHPYNDASKSGTAGFSNTTYRLAGWPSVENGFGDAIYADFDVEWQYNGHSLGNVSITPVHANDAWAWGLEVKATINDDERVYVGGVAGIRLNFNYRFDRTIGSDCIANRSLVLYADGTHYEKSKWTQKPDGWWGADEMSVARAQGGGVITEIASPIAETILKLIVDSAEGDIDYELPQLEGMKHVDDNKANRGGAVQTKSLDLKLPSLENGFSDEISLTLRINWQYDGRSLGNIVIQRAAANDAIGWGLTVKGKLLNDAATYRAGAAGPTFAGVQLLFESTFIGPFGINNSVALSKITLYGNGVYQAKHEWTQW